ncbi:MAG: TIGR01777 family oxidoreductase [Deltaproteobacteria bacterium]|nr:TIGR01777 family oxidoreductase [Deltaproteobacteria bacterium]
MLKVTVTGATGMIGRPLVRRLLDDGCAVRAWSRDVEAARALLPAACAVEGWDPAGAVDPHRLRGTDALVHLAGAGVADRRWSAAYKRVIRDSRVGPTRALVEAMAALPPAERPRVLVGASGIGIYGDRGDERLDETSAPGAGFLAEVSREWEAAARRAEALGVRVVLLRIGMALAAGGGALGRLLPPFRLGLGGPVGGGGQWMSWIHRDDLVELVCFALRQAHVAGVLNAVAPAPVVNRDFSAALGQALARPARLPIPAAALRLAFGELGGVLLASQRALPAAALRHGFAFRFADVAAALRDCCADLSQVIDVEQWLPQPPAAVFAFFADAANLERITPPFLHFRVLGSSTPALGTGTLIDYRLRLHGVPLRWRSVIERWQPERGFVDRQLRGPYALWEHTHQFTAANDGTLVRDRIRYRLPFGALGEVIAGRWVARDLARIFAFRRAASAAIFAAPSTGVAVEGGT